MSSDTVFYWVLFLVVGVWIGGWEADDKVARWFTTREFQSIARFAAWVVIFLYMMACVLGIYWLRDQYPSWFFVALVCGMIWWGVSRGHALVKAISR